jgi:hypothetical protein
MTDQLTTDELDLILESLRYTKQAFSSYKDYPTDEFRRQQVARVDTVIEKIRGIRNAKPR